MKNKFTFKNFFQILKLCKGFYLKGFFLITSLIATSFLSTYPIKYIEKIINICTSTYNNKFNIFIKLGLIFLALQISNIVFRAIFEYLNADLETSIGHKIRILLFEKLEKMPFTFYEKNNSSDLIMRLVQDSSITVDGVLQPITFIVNNLLTFILGFIYMFSIDKTLTLFMLPIGVIVSLFILKTGPKIGNLSEKERTSSSDLWNSFIESVNGIKEIKINSQEKRIFNFITKKSLHTKSVIMNLKKYTIKTSNINSSFFMIIISFIMILGGYKVTLGKLSIGALSAIMMYNGLLINPMINFFELYQKMQRVFVSCDKIFSILNAQEEENIYKYSNIKFKENISIKNLYFKYNNNLNKYNLFDISLNIKKGEKIALVGYSGSGKSTLCKILIRYYQTFKGIIKIDDINIKEIDLKNIKNIFGVVFQENHIFSGTLKENIIFSNPKASNESINKALKISGVNLFLNNLPNGLNTIIGENGFNLSGGERQRIFICRTIIKNPDILILDESTSSLDSKTTSIITKNLLKHFADKTIIFVAHKLTSITNICDKIYVFNNGYIIESGTHIELMGKSSAYKELYNSQFIK